MELESLKEFYVDPLNGLCASLCKAINIEPPSKANKENEKLLAYVNEKTNKKGVDKIIMYNPDAIGAWIYESYPNLFQSFKNNSELELKLLTAFPPKTPVCFGTMYTGANPEVHGIQRYEKPVIKIDTFFDALIRAGKKPCIVAVQNSSMAKIYLGKDMDYYFEKYDGEVVERAIQLIEEDKYDVICIYNQEYDDAMHRTHPKSLWSKGAIKRYNESFERIGNAVRENLSSHNTLLGCAPDHGVHREWYLLGQHGKMIPKDMNIVHWYGVYPKQK